MSSDDVSISVIDLSKCYEIYEKPRDRLRQFVFPMLQNLVHSPPKKYYKEFWALKDITFEVNRGETVGIVGRNGSGKSTLLQLICGTLTPTRGKIRTRGRVAALLELGSGFNPELTGRENVYLNASLLGLNPSEINARFDEIVAFADIGNFIDQPLKTFSSGMMMRLAFAVQSQIDPDILIVDEALSVGDAKFQAKCFERLRRLKDNGTSILLVTHSTEQIVTHCTQAILLNNGNQLEIGEPKLITNRYLDLLLGKDRSNSNISHENTALANDTEFPDRPLQLSQQTDVFCTRSGYNPHEYRWGDGEVSIIDFSLSANDSIYPPAISTGQDISLTIAVKFHTNKFRPIFGFTLKTKEGITVYGTNSESFNFNHLHKIYLKDSVHQFHAAFNCRLASGDYFISVGISTRNGEEIIPHDRRYDSIHIHVLPERKFFGITDLRLKLSTQEML